MAAATTFLSFPSLPTELRIFIWSLAVMHPCRVEIDAQEIKRRTDWLSRSPPPAVMHVCRDSRVHAPYTRAFEAVMAGTGAERYAWVTFDIDMAVLVTFGEGSLDWGLAPLNLLGASELPSILLVQRLRVPFAEDSEWTHESFVKFPGEKLRPFTSLRELQITIPYWDVDGPVDLTNNEEPFGTCKSENVRFMDRRTGLLLEKGEIFLRAHWGRKQGGLLCEDEVDEFEWYAEQYHDPWAEQVENVLRCYYLY